MIVVIQCAASKSPDAGFLLTAEGKPVKFVAHPEIAPANNANAYARPDDKTGEGKSCRDRLLGYNRAATHSASCLYENPVYERLVDRLGVENVYILSAGWGLIRSDFLTPYYDITFSPSARGGDAYKRRRKANRYDDFSMLPEHTDEEILFFGGKDYLPLFCTLTQTVTGRRKVFYNAAQTPQVPCCATVKFETSTRTNWHYECAIAFLESL